MRYHSETAPDMADIETNKNEYRPMQAVKRHFFAMRNGVVADALRKAGSPFRYIFGMNLPQLVDAAASVGRDAALAEDLWANSTTRESMLLAPMLMPPDDFDIAHARRWVESVPATEVADILCHRLLRHEPYSAELALEYAVAGKPDMQRYTAGRLALNILYSNPEAAREVLALLAVAPGPLAASVSRQLTNNLADL